MKSKFIIIGMMIGSGIGSYVPALFGVSIFSMISILTGLVGGIIGIYVGYKFSQGM